MDQLKLLHNIKFRAFVYEDESADEISQAILNILPEAEIEAEEAEGLLENKILILTGVVSKKRYTKAFFNTLLENVDLELNKGEFIYLIGKVGTGKTSLLKTFYGELEILSGEAKVLGYDMKNIKRSKVPALRKRLGIVFRDFQLLTDRTVRDNLKFVLKATGWKDKALIDDRIEEALKEVDMEGKGYKMPNHLSGGDQQRIVIARAILNKPDIILADEPTGNLDPETGMKIVELLRSICQSGSAIVMSTHNLQLVEKYPGVVYRCQDHHIKEVTNEFYNEHNDVKIDEVSEMM